VRSGTKLVLVFVVVAAGVFVVLRVYGERFAAFHAASTPIAAARERVMADNTVVGRLGGIRDVELVEVHPIDALGDTVALAAEVVGHGGGGMLFADLARDGREWRVLRASFRAPDGERLPLEDGSPTLDPDR
jgi:hypothetical protein